MENLNLTGSADFTAMFDALDTAEKRMRDFAQIAPNITPKLDLRDQLRALDDLDARLKKISEYGLKIPRAPRAPATPGTPAPDAPLGPTPQDNSQADQLRKRLVEIHNLAAILRNDFQAAGSAVDITDEEVAQLQGRVQTLQGELRELRPIAEATFGKASSEVKNLTLTTAQLQRTVLGATNQMSRMGIASQFKLGIDNSVLTQNPQQAVNGAVQLVRVYEQARLGSLSFQKALDRQNVSVAQAEAFVERYAERFNVVPSAVQSTMKVLLNNGYTVAQAQETLERYAASALVAAKDVGGAVEALASDVQMGTTVLSNQYGITANQATAWNQYAKSINVAADALTAEQKAEGYLWALRRETANDMRDADTILQGVGGTLGKTSQEFRKAQQELGEALLPTVTNGAKQLTRLLQEFNKLDPAVKNTVVTAGTFLVAWGGIRVILGPVLGLFKSAVPVLKQLTQGAGKAGAARAAGELGEGLAGAAGKAKGLNKGLIELSEVGKQKGLWAKLGDGVKTLITPIRNGLPVIGQFVKSLAANPATKGGLYGAVAALGYGVGTLISKFVTFKGLSVGEHVQNFSLKAFSGYSQEDVNKLRLEEIRTVATTKALQAQAQARKKLRDEQNKDIRASEGRRLNMELDLAVEQAVLDRARKIGDQGAALAAQDRIKTLTQALGFERQNRATIEDSIKAAEKLRDLEEKRRPVLEALWKTQAELAARSFDIQVGAKSNFEQDFIAIRREFGEQRKQLEAQLKNEKDVVIKAEIKTTLDKLDRVEGRAITARTAEELKAGADEVAAAQRDVEAARLGVMKEGAGQRQAQLEQELRAIRDEYAPKVKAALENALLVKGPDRAAFQQQAGQLQGLQRQAEGYARQAAAKDLERIREEEEKKAEEERKKIEERVRAAQEAEGRVLQARAQAADTVARIVEGEKTRELRLYGQSATGRLKIEQRYAQAIGSARQQAVLLQAQAEARALQRTYDDQMKFAKDAGAQRGELEANARTEYLTKLSTLEQDTALKVRDIQLGVQQDVLNARLAVQQEALDRELKNIGTATGAELTSLRVRLQARRTAAISRGDVQTAEQLAAALRQIETLNTDRVADLKRLIQEAGKGAVDLRQRLTDALPKNPLQKARSEAASPFNSIIKDAQARVADLNKAYGKIGTPTAAQTTLFRKAVAEQNTIIRDAQLERNQAILTAEQATNRQLLADRRALAREEIEAALKVAQSDEKREELRLRLLGLDRSRLMEVNAELRALNGRANAEERIAALRREQWTLEGRIAEYSEGQQQRAEALEASLLNLTRAQVDRMETLALTDQEVTRSREARLALALQELAVLDQRIKKAREEKADAATQNDLQAQRIGAAVQVAQAERALIDQALRASEQQLATDQARARAKGRILALGDDAVAAARTELRFIRQGMEYHAARLANAKDLKLTSDQVRESEEALFNGQADLAEGERALTRAMQDRLTLARNIEEALRAVNDASAAQGTDLEQAALRMDEATRKLQRARAGATETLARVANGEMMTDEDVTRLGNLTEAIREQRDAVRELGDEYRKQVESIGGLSDAIANLNDTISPKTKTGEKEFSAQREIQDLRRLESRRSIALSQLEKAIQEGDPEKITQALNNVNTQEQAYRKEVERLKKEGYGPYLNLVDQQKDRVIKNVKDAQGVLDDLIADGMTNLNEAEALQKKADADSGDSVVVRTADALADAMNSGSALLADRVLESLANGADLIEQAVKRVQAIQVTVPDADVRAQGVQEGDVTNYGDFILYWQNQQMPTPPDLRAMFRQFQQWAADEARRNPPCRR